MPIREWRTRARRMLPVAPVSLHQVDRDPRGLILHPRGSSRTCEERYDWTLLAPTPPIPSILEGTTGAPPS